jgi:hypothetical protein
LLQITANLALLNPTFDDTVALKILQTLEDEIGESLNRAQKRLEEDEELFQSQRKSLT